MPEKQGPEGERLLGLDVEPRVGQRVQMAVGFFPAGQGTVTGVGADEGSVSVKWDSGVVDRLLIGEDGVYALALVAHGAEASGEWDS